ncbi:MAG TPA: acyl-CoA carboxylase epsilon subunit [Actinomycetota bacterium]|nr:acyl-CoA carboxylase epsilon subunit [Actinomycetota bacterium]
MVVALLTAAANSATAAPAPEPASNWARTAMRVTHAAGPGAWWRSGLPQP